MVSICNVLSREMVEMMEITSSLKTTLSLKDGVIDDLYRAENGVSGRSRSDRHFLSDSIQIDEQMIKS